MSDESKGLSWAWVTADKRLEQGECELLYAYLVVSAASTDTHIYSGTDTSGEKIVTLEAAAATGHPFKPPKPVYCPRGIYVDVGSNVTGVFVQWRKL